LDIYVSWKNLSFSVPDPKDKNKNKIILENLNGCVKPGELIAVIGPSGSGKSSFLNCIAGRNIQGVTGQIAFNDVARPTNFARFTGYVIQDDLYFQSLTVRETLQFAASLKLPRSLSKQERHDRVTEIVEELDLQKCADTVIGAIGAGISGGERRRLAIGLEILNNPSLLLLDEPTSGLDSASALMVGRILKTLAERRNITVLCTVHQPRFALAAMFDKLYFLGLGRELYFGPTVPHCLQFFEDAGYKCPEYVNPADFLLDLVNTTTNDGDKKDDENEEGEDSRNEIIKKLATAYQASEYRANALDYSVPEDKRGDIVFGSISNAFYITSMWNQIAVVAHRSFIFKLREPIATATQAFNAILMPVLFGSVYFGLDLTQQGSYDRISAISLVVLILAFFAMDILMLFPTERNIFNREQASGMYRPISFFIGRTIAETPQHILFTTILSTISYWMYGLQNDGHKFLIFLAVTNSLVVSSSGLLLAFSAAAKDIEQSNLLATLFVLMFMLFDGNWISLDKIPVYWRWISWISCIGYASHAAITNEYTGLVFTCTAQEVTDGLCEAEGGIPGEQILYNRGMEGVDIGRNIMMLWVTAIAYRVVAFICFWLMYRNHSATQIIKATFGMESRSERMKHSSVMI